MFECLKSSVSDAEYIFKKDLEKFTGGVITAHTFVNLVVRGQANVPDKIKIGNKIAYRTVDIINWLEENAKEDLRNAEF